MLLPLSKRITSRPLALLIFLKYNLPYFISILAVLLMACTETKQEPAISQADSKQALTTKPQPSPDQIAAAPQMDPAATTAFKQGLFYIQAKDYTAAETALRQALALDSKAAVLHHHLGLTLQSLGRYDEAVTEYQAAMDLDPSSPTPLIALGRMRYDVQGDVTSATTLLKQALDLDANQISALFTLGLINQREGNLETAIDYFTQVSARDTLFEKILTQIGMCYLQAGDLPMAETALTRAARAYPHEPTAFMGLGQTMIRQEKTELGQRLLARSQQLTEQADTLETYAQAVRTNPRVPQAHYNLAVVLARYGRYAQAEGHYTYALKLDSTYVLPYEGLGLLYQRQGKNERAATLFRQVLARDSTLADAHNNLGLAYHRLGQLEEAVLSYQTALRLDSNQVYYYSNLGNAYRDLDQLEKAHEVATKALQINPDLPGAQELMGDVQALQGNLAEAIATWHRLAKRTPANRALAIKLKRAEKLLESGTLE